MSFALVSQPVPFLINLVESFRPSGPFGTLKYGLFDQGYYRKVLFTSTVKIVTLAKHFNLLTTVKILGTFS